MRCYYRKYFRHRTNNNEKKRKTYRPVARQKHTLTQTGSILSRIFKRMVPVDYSYQSKKKYQEPFLLLVQLCQFPIRQTSNLMRRSLHLSTWSPRFTSHDLYLRCRSLASRAKHSFYFGPPKINGSNSKLSLLWLRNFEKMEKNYEDINTTASFSVLRCFRSTCYFLLIIPHERMFLLPINTKEGCIQNKTHVPSRVLLLCAYS